MYKLVSVPHRSRMVIMASRSLAKQGQNPLECQGIDTYPAGLVHVI